MKKTCEEKTIHGVVELEQSDSAKLTSQVSAIPPFQDSSLLHGFDSRIPLFYWPNVNSETQIGRNPESAFFCFRRGVDSLCESFLQKVNPNSIGSTIKSTGQRLRVASFATILRGLTKSLFVTTVFGMLFAGTLTPTAFCSGVKFPTTEGKASFYSTEACRFNPTKDCKFADGTSLYTAEDRGVLYCAMWRVPFGTRLKVTNLKNNKSVIVTVKDRGPAKRLNRIIDLGKSAFAKIADTKLGTIQVRVEAL